MLRCNAGSHGRCVLQCAACSSAQSLFGKTSMHPMCGQQTGPEEGGSEKETLSQFCTARHTAELIALVGSGAPAPKNCRIIWPSTSQFAHLRQWLAASSGKSRPGNTAKPQTWHLQAPRQRCRSCVMSCSSWSTNIFKAANSQAAGQPSHRKQYGRTSSNGMDSAIPRSAGENAPSSRHAWAPGWKPSLPSMPSREL